MSGILFFIFASCQPLKYTELRRWFAVLQKITQYSSCSGTLFIIFCTDNHYTKQQMSIHRRRINLAWSSICLLHMSHKFTKSCIAPMNKYLKLLLEARLEGRLAKGRPANRWWVCHASRSIASLPIFVTDVMPVTSCFIQPNHLFAGLPFGGQTWRQVWRPDWKAEDQRLDLQKRWLNCIKQDVTGMTSVTEIGRLAMNREAWHTIMYLMARPSEETHPCWRLRSR